MAGLLTQLYGRVRKTLEGLDAEGIGNDEGLVLTQQLELLVAAGATPNGEITKVGRSFWIGTTTAVAAVVAIPTTAVMLAIYNNEPDGGRSYVIDWVGASGVAKSAAIGQQQLICNIGQTRAAVPTNSALVAKKNNGLGGGTNDTRALSIISGTALDAITGVAANWFPLGPSVGNPTAVAVPGHGLWQAVDGRFIVPPGRYFAMHVIADVVGNTYQGFIAWHERQMVLG